MSAVYYHVHEIVYIIHIGVKFSMTVYYTCVKCLNAAEMYKSAEFESRSRTESSVQTSNKCIFLLWE